MTQSISLTIPLTLVALRSTARYMTDLAAEIESEQLGAPSYKFTDVKLPRDDGYGYTIDNAVANVPNAATVAAVTELNNGGGEIVQSLFDGIDAEDEAGAPPPPGVTVDKTGLPWDERIHASSRALIKDGTWRKRKNVDDATVAAVEAELRQVLGAKAPDNIVIPPLVETPVIAAPPAPPVVAAPPAPPAPTVVTAPPAPPVADGVITDQATLMGTLVTPAMQAGKLQAAQFLAILKQFGIVAVPMIKNAPHLIPEIAKAVRETIKANGHE